MTKTASVRFNFMMNTLLTLSNVILPIITFPYVSRVLQAEGTGRVSFVGSVVAYFVMIGMLGIPNYGIRQCAKVREDKDALSKTVQEIFVLNIIAMTVSIVLYSLAVLSVPRLAQEKTLFIVNLALLIGNVIGMDWVYRGLEQYANITVRSLIFKLIAVVLLFLFVQKQSDVISYGVVTIVASVGSNILNFINIRKLVNITRYPDLNILQHVRPVLNFFMLTIATTVYTNLDTVMVGFISGNIEVGYYNASVKIKSILLGLVTSLGAVLLPRLAYYISQKNTVAFTKLSQKAFNFIVVIAMPLTIYFMLMASESIRFLSGNGYHGSILPMQILMPTILLIGISNLIGMQILVPINKELYVVQSVTIGAIVNVFINSILIAPYGATGAAIGTLIAEMTVTIYQWVKIAGFMSVVFDKKNNLKILFATVMAVIGILFIPPVGNDFVQLVMTSIVFFGVYGLMLLIIKETFVTETLKGLWRKKHV